MTEFLDWLADAADRRAARGLTRRLHTTKPGDLLDLAGNDYLGLRTDPRVIAAAVAAVESHGGGSGASRLVTGTLPIHDDLEATLAGLLGSPAALVLPPGMPRTSPPSPPSPTPTPWSSVTPTPTPA